MSTRNETTQHSAPIPISGGGHHRARSGSESSFSSSGTPPPVTPRSVNTTLPRVNVGPGTSPTSPIISLILGGQSPTTVKSPTAFPFARNPFCGTAVEEDEHEEAPQKHSRRASISTMPARFHAAPPVPAAANPLQGAQGDRGTGLLRRLSLGGQFARPQVSPPSMNMPKSTTPPPIQEGRQSRTFPRNASPPSGSPRAGKRRATLNVPAPPPRAPSPMGERILKGHFDGFN